MGKREKQIKKEKVFKKQSANKIRIDIKIPKNLINNIINKFINRFIIKSFYY